MNAGRHFYSGNICRSPTADAVFTNAVKKRGLDSQFKIDSLVILLNSVTGALSVLPDQNDAPASRGPYVGVSWRQMTSEYALATMDGSRSGVALFRLPSTIQRQKSERPSSAWGVGLIVLGVLVLVVFLYTAIISKMLPPSGIYLLDALRDDWYYVLLVPLTIPTMVVAVYLHWLSMKLFKHA